MLFDSRLISTDDGWQAFPPAMPASLIFTAFGQVMQVWLLPKGKEEMNGQ